MKKTKYLFVLLFIIDIKCYSQIIFNTAEEAANYALINSADFNYQRLNTELSMKIAKQAIGDFLPSFSFSVNDNKTLNYLSPDNSSKSIILSVNQFLFDGGKKYTAYEMGKSNSLYAYKEYLQSEKEFKSQIISQYYQCVNQIQLVSLKKDLEDIAEEQLEILKTEYELGLALENDYLEYLISVKKIQNERMSCEREYRTLMRKFKIALSLDPQVELILTENPVYKIDENIILEDHFEFLWDRYKQLSIEMQKSDMMLYYAEKQYQYVKKQYLPEITFSGTLNFSGETYPLTQPFYSFKINFAFSNFPLLPVAGTSGLDLNSKGKLTKLSNEVSVPLSAPLNYLESLQTNEISIQQKKQEKKNTEFSSYEAFFDLITQYDDFSNNLAITEETLRIQERRLKISEDQMNAGRIKRIDYLKQLTELAGQKTDFINAQNSILASARNLEIMLDIPFGGLKDVVTQDVKKK